MKRQPADICGHCNTKDAVGHLFFDYELPEKFRARHQNAPAVVIDMALCASCGEKFYKHLKRFFGNEHFRPTVAHDAGTAWLNR